MSTTYRICYKCNEKKPMGKFRRSEFLCNECIEGGAKAPKASYISHCKWCNTEIATAPGRDKSFCNNSCYQHFLLSDKNPRRGVPCRKKISPTSDPLERPDDSHVERCKSTLKNFQDITKLCKQLNISYGQYQQYKASGELDRMIRQLENQ